MSHKNSQETYDYIAQWIHPNFFFSTEDKWSRFGILGVFGDYILSSLEGDILEIGVGVSSIYLTELAKKFNRRIYHCDIEEGKILGPATVDGYLSKDYIYLNGHNLDKNYVADELPKCILFASSSDDFFKHIKFTKLALAFIDGDHNYEQVKKDFENVLPYMVDNGYIIFHDTYPPSDEYTNENLCGTVYKLRQEIEKDPRFDSLTLPEGTAMKIAVTIVRKKPANLKEYQR